MTVLLCLAGSLAIPSASHGLIFSDETTEPAETVPPDFPYWEHVTQRRYEGPTVIYLGAGWALTARHVGRGEILLKGRIIRPKRFSRHTLLNADGRAADAMVFELDRETELPDLPILPIATAPPKVGEEVLMIGFGRLRNGRIDWGDPENPRAAYTWTARGEKRWGTNRVEFNGVWQPQNRWLTRSIVTRFDPTDFDMATEHEASAALGDSGGAIFAKQDGEWRLAGLITSISNLAGRPDQTTELGDLTYAADLSSYRNEILRWTRPRCSNGQDDDADTAIDYPDDTDCQSPDDDSEHPDSWILDSGGWSSWALLACLGLGLGLRVAIWTKARRQRGRSRPDSMRPSTTT